MIGMHMPSVPTRLHAWHVPLQALVQQTPSTHERPAMQSWGRPQGPPGGRSGRQNPTEQWAAAMQSVSPMQLVGQLRAVCGSVPLQTMGLYVPQSCAVIDALHAVSSSIPLIALHVLLTQVTTPW